MDLLNHKEIGKRLEEKRLSLELSSNKFAKKAKIDPSQYSKIEKGDLPITSNTLEKLIKTYSLDKNNILFGTIVPHEKAEKIDVTTKGASKKTTQIKFHKDFEIDMPVNKNLSDQALADLAQSNKLLAEANIVLARSHEKIVNKLLAGTTEDSHLRILAAVEARLTDLQEFVGGVALGKTYRTQEEVDAVLHRFDTSQEKYKQEDGKGAKL